GFVPDTSSALADRFVRNLPLVATFLTNAAHDHTIWSPGIPAGLATLSSVSSVRVDTAPRPGVDRPGVIEVTLAAGGTFEIRYPSYANAGHMVSVKQPGELAADVATWLASRAAPTH